MKKPRAHVVDSLAIAFLKEFFADWVFNELPEDYSLDVIITSNTIKPDLII